MLRRQVPPVITASCLAWYGHWCGTSTTAGSEITKTATRLVDDWIAHAEQRLTIEAAIVELARSIAGHPHRSFLEERPF